MSEDKKALQDAAKRYSELETEASNLEEKINSLRLDRDKVLTEQRKSQDALAESVGANISERVFSVESGRVVIVRWVNPKAAERPYAKPYVSVTVKEIE